MSSSPNSSSCFCSNGVVFGGDPGTIAYFRDEVVGGTGAFLIAADDSPAVLEVMRRKFLQDLVAGPPPPSASLF